MGLFMFHTVRCRLRQSLYVEQMLQKQTRPGGFLVMCLKLGPSSHSFVFLAIGWTPSLICPSSGLAEIFSCTNNSNGRAFLWIGTKVNFDELKLY